MSQKAAPPVGEQVLNQSYQPAQDTIQAQRVASLIPGWIPGANFWSYLCGLALVGAGGAILFGYRLRQVAFLLGIMFILLAFLLHIPRVLADPYSVLGGESSSVFQALSFGGAAFVLAAWSRPTRATSTTPRAAAQ